MAIGIDHRPVANQQTAHAASPPQEQRTLAMPGSSSPTVSAPTHSMFSSGKVLRLPLALCLCKLGFMAAAQPPPQPVRSRPPPFSPQALGQRVAQSIDAGDSYLSADGLHWLRRVPGKVVVSMTPPSNTRAAAQALVGRGETLAGYTLAARPPAGLAIFTAPAAETQRQREEPDRLRQVVK